MGYFVGDFALGEVAYVGELDALVTFREPPLLAFRGSAEVDGVGQAAA